MSWAALERAERSVRALLKSVRRNRSPETRAAVATELVVSLDRALREANALRYDAFAELVERGWTVDDLRRRWGLVRSDGFDGTAPRAVGDGRDAARIDERRRA